MTFSNAVSTGFSNFFNPYGRASRSEYWWYWLFLFIVAIVITFIMLIIEHLPGFGVAFVSIFSGIIELFMSITILMAAIRRLHDIGKSGWNVCWSFIPIVGAIYVIVLLCRPSEQGANRYGEMPQ